MKSHTLKGIRPKTVVQVASRPDAYERLRTARIATAEHDQRATGAIVEPALRSVERNLDPSSSPSAPQMISVSAMPLARISVPSDRRTFGDGEVEALAANMAEVGQLSPILVTRSVGNDGSEQFRLVAGKARLAAAAQLNWPTINVICIPDGLDPELCAVMENLGRVDLRALDRAEHIALWVDRHQRSEHRISGNVGQKSKAGTAWWLGSGRP